MPIRRNTAEHIVSAQEHTASLTAALPNLDLGNRFMLSAFRARLMAAQAALDACSILLDQLDTVHTDCGAVLAALAAKEPDCGLLQ